MNRAKIDLEQRPVPDSTTEATSAESDKNAANTVRNATEAATTKETAKSSFDDGSFMDGKRMVIVPEATKHKKPRRDPAAVDANATLDIDKAAEDLARDGFKVSPREPR